ncbi:MAG TPA: indolepyruvate oxidoreductase subunit beta [Ruminococcaceae bacterium]|nr:indolepyruvate oxidoreductase subunit beta [Oscillospiraceae bacterium]
MKKELNVIIVGVGGQGTLLASRLLGNALISSGYDIKVSEVHGMSQRGGSVVTYVRAGKEVASPIIERGGADIMLAFEPLEAARWLSYLKKGGRIIVNTGKIDPMPVITGASEYPEGIIEKLAGKNIDLTVTDALSLAKEAGSVKAVNVVLMGILATGTDIPLEVWEQSVNETVPERFLELNLKAFRMGYEQ